MERILVLMDTACETTQAKAREAACYPERLTLKTGDWESAPELWQGEAFILFLPAGADFLHHWDLALLALWRSLKDRRALLTGYLPRREDPFGPMPVAASGFDPQGRLCFGPGMPLCHCPRPQRAAFVHPGFLLLPKRAAQLMEASGPEPLFMKAFQADLPIYTLNRRVFTHPAMPAIPPAEPWAPFEEGTPLADFEESFGLRWASRQLSADARLGQFAAPYALRPGPHVILREALRRHTLRNQPAQPLLVTAWREMACPVEALPGEYECHFQNLARLKELPLLVYAAEEDLRRMKRLHHNVYAYRHRYGLPIETVWAPEDDLKQFLAGKVFLIQRTMSAHPYHTHYGWIDFGCQRWPLYERTAFDWQPLCDDTIHLARVDGKIDPSLIMIPREQIPFVCGEMLKAVRDAIDQGPLPDEAQLWESVIARRPQVFTLHTLTQKRQLLRLCLGHKEETL